MREEVVSIEDPSATHCMTPHRRALRGQGPLYTRAMGERPRVRVVRPADREVEVSSGAMTRLAGVSEATAGASGIHLAIATVPAGCGSSAHAHINCESAIYIVSGRGRFLAGEDLEETLAVGPGDFLYIPSDAPHQPLNDSAQEPLVMIVARNSPVELVVELGNASASSEQGAERNDFEGP